MYSGLFARKVWPKLWNCAKKGKGQRHAMFRRGVVAEACRVTAAVGIDGFIGVHVNSVGLLIMLY
jgi:hypothetical protein